ncbi:hypothetical protein ACFWBB_31050 [Streptomyces sp. NPDC060000]|uniref:hypothetical protein n=1 Tax=Streptomyces sp. NPDC060000 TaxID=3347031 RepID=UPI0036B5205E
MTTAPALLALDTLDTDELSSLYAEAGRILQERSEAELPAVILEAIREVLAEDGDTRKPLRAVFSTTEWENGYFWYADGARVTFFDGRTEEIETVDLSSADEALTDHVSYLVDPLDSTDTLTVVFEPPTVQMG